MLGKIICDLAPKKNNPRNSEGAFIELKSGRIMFAYTHYLGDDGDDVLGTQAVRQQRPGEPVGAGVELAVGPPVRAVHDGDLVGVHVGGALEERQRRQLGDPGLHAW